MLVLYNHACFPVLSKIIDFPCYMQRLHVYYQVLNQIFMSVFANYDQTWASIIFAYDEFAYVET